jgi:hypothetical protein
MMSIININKVEELSRNKLATQPLKNLLLIVGWATTPQEERILAALLRDYKRMRSTFPSKQLGTDLDALYSQAFSAVHRVVLALTGFGGEYCSLLLEAKGLSLARMTPRSKPKILKVCYEASDLVRRDVTSILKRCDEVLFFTLAAASKQINAALKSAQKKK